VGFAASAIFVALPASTVSWVSPLNSPAVPVTRTVSPSATSLATAEVFA
jgi:hypothetical protein